MEYSPSPINALATRKVDRLLWSLAAVAAVVGSCAMVEFTRAHSLEARLYHAAIAAAQEATAPGASRTSVALEAQRILARDGCDGISPTLELKINSRRTNSRSIYCRSGDVVSVTLGTDVRWPDFDILRSFSLPLSPAPLIVTAVLREP